MFNYLYRVEWHQEEKLSSVHLSPLILSQPRKSLGSCKQGYKSSQAKQGIKPGNPTYFCACWLKARPQLHFVEQEFYHPSQKLLSKFTNCFKTIKMTPLRQCNALSASLQISGNPIQYLPAQTSCLTLAISCYLSNPKFIASKI